jgi:hypothetical protein
MRRYFASVVLVLTVPAFATIAPVQHSPLAIVSNSSTCKPMLSSGTSTGNLLVVWATWTPGNTVSITTGGWPTFTFFVKVGTTRSDVTAFLLRPRVSWLGGQPSPALLRDE